jgi:hypothetical protein
VTICDGRRLRRSSRITSRPASNATRSLARSIAGTLALPIGEMPSISKAVAIVLAVNWPPHAPAPGQAKVSMFRSSSAEILPALKAPTASKTS